MSAERSAPVFFYDLGNPECYLAAERIMSGLPVAPEWEPIVERHPTARLDTDEIESRGRELGLQPFRWPAAWPPDTALAMLTATYAKQIGRAVAFSLAAFRQVYAGGRDLGDENTVLIAGAACEMHPTAVLRAVQTRGVRAALDSACERAAAAAVVTLPSITVGDTVFDGPDAVERAAAVLGERLFLTDDD